MKIIKTSHWYDTITALWSRLFPKTIYLKRSIPTTARLRAMEAFITPQDGWDWKTHAQVKAKKSK